uniref:clp protease proteolytic subunit n=1 Tax=Berberis pinnata TaxID=258192 RepID=UPI002182422E|nr:clp protease proteolytic subunit [Berberis pinnata]UVJ68229.1 clp protease proteolytic subunit [Berberis pinnata]
MPVGVPKVPFRIPGDEDATWVDLYLINRLHRERLLFLGDSIEDELANQVMGLMLFLNIEDKDLEQWLFINSPGGWIVPGVGIYDMMQLVIPDVNTVCMGVAASMASFVLVGGEITKRLAFLRACMLYHQGNDAPTCWYLFSARNTRIYARIEGYFRVSRQNRKNIFRTNTTTPLGYSRRPGKRYFYGRKRSQRVWNYRSYSRISPKYRLKYRGVK